MPPWLLYTLGVLIFAFGLLASIALHEVGHMLPAKKFGVKVTQYMVGFGPTLWSRRRGDTEYGVKAIPVGGYIRMIGMVPPRADGSRSRWPRRMATAIEDFRRVSRSEVSPGDQDREFYRLTPGKKMIVMLGGPCMNLLIYVVLTVIIVMTLGTPHDRPTTTVGAISRCYAPAGSQAATARSQKCTAATKPTPAYTSLKIGDQIESINGTPVTSWDELTPRIRDAAGVTLHLVVRRAGKDVPVDITPVKTTFYPEATDKKPTTAGYVGLSPANYHYYATLGVTQVPGEIGRQLRVGVDAIGSYPHKIASLYRTVFEGAKRDQNGAVGVVGIGRISGDYARSKYLTAKDKLFTLVSLLASVNLLLFFFNLLPLLPLDGGHVAGALVEAAKRGRARLRMRRGLPARRADGLTDVPDPAALDASGRPVRAARPQIFVDTAQMLPIMYAVASVLVLLTVLTLYADIVKPINPLGG